MTATMRDAARLWQFLCGERHALAGSQLIIVCGSYDLRVCDHACGLLQRGIAPRLLITGGHGNWTRHLWAQSEASVFADRARQHGVSDAQLLLEPHAGNFAENIAFARQLCPDVRRATFVTKPNSVRRVQQTLPIQWAGLEAAVDAPVLAFPQDISQLIGVLGLIDEMVGDLQRLLVYPQWGFQLPLPVPADIVEAWQALIAAGFDRHLLAPPAGPAAQP